MHKQMGAYQLVPKAKGKSEREKMTSFILQYQNLHKTNLCFFDIKIYVQIYSRMGTKGAHFPAIVHRK